jgi:hypothetical protein
MSNECEDADKNPKCPYLATIVQSSKDIGEIKKALIGDLEHPEGGLVSRIGKIEDKLKRRWNMRDIGALLLGLSALLAAIVAILKG